VGLRKEYAPTSPLLEPFLFSFIGEEKSGMQLTVISAFARFGTDPWEEASRLAALPRAMASDALGALIARLPDGRWELPESAAIASRLVKLLPVPEPETRPRDAEGWRSTPRYRAAIWGMWLLLAAALMFSAQQARHAPDVPPVEQSSSR
jgi:hypothetical protein